MLYLDLGRKNITGKQNNVSVSKLNENNPIGFKIWITSVNHDQL